MIDVDCIPAPEGAPEPGLCIRVDRPRDGLAVVVLDPPHRKLAVLDRPLLSDLSAVIDELEKDETLKGIVIAGRRPDQFAVGADVRAIESITDPVTLEKVIREVHKLLRQIESLKARTVAAVGGPVPGGAFELAMSCDCIVAADSSKTRIGLPETQLGIIPAWGGSHRLPRRIGVPAALPLILTGRLLPAVVAWKKGLVDRVTKPEYLLDVASKIAMGEEPIRRKRRGIKRLLVDRNPLAMQIVASQARKQVMQKTRGQYPAPLEAIDLVVRSPARSMVEAADVEARAGGRLATGPVAKSLISIFFASEQAKKLGRRADGEKVRSHQRGAVIGAGVMGGAIASLMAEKGIATRLADLSLDALDAAVHEHRAVIEKKRRQKRLQNHQADAALDHLDSTEGLVGLSSCEVIVEAVAEKLEIKQQVLGKLAAQVAPDAVLATNTSSLSVDAIAEGIKHPERVVGLHFFNPVRKMPLVEIIKGSKTSEDVVTEMAALALRLGKTPVVVKDVAGFLVNRILAPYMDEAARMFQCGADIQRIDKVMLAFGMPMGPFALFDEVGLDIASHAAPSLHEAYGARMTPSTVVDALLSPERLGRKTGWGFYRYSSRGKARPQPSEDLSKFQDQLSAAEITDEQIVDRLVLCMVNEAARCLEEEVVQGPASLDLATVFGTGFAPFRGGLLRYADSRGSKEVVAALAAIAASPDIKERAGGVEKFTPAPLLKQLAEVGSGFHSAGESTVSQGVGDKVTAVP